MFEYNLVPLTRDRLSEAVELDRLCLGGLWTLEGYEREFDSPNSDLLTILAHSSISTSTESDRLVGLGCLWAILEEAHLTLLLVHPEHRRQGLGRQLLRGLLDSARSRGLEWATLEVGEHNEAALSLYQKFGFETIGRRKKYYQKTGEDALILWRKGLQRDF